MYVGARTLKSIKHAIWSVTEGFYVNSLYISAKLLLRKDRFPWGRKGALNFQSLWQDTDDFYLSIVLLIRQGRALESILARKGMPAGIGGTTSEPKSTAQTLQQFVMGSHGRQGETCPMWLEMSGNRLVSPKEERISACLKKTFPQPEFSDYNLVPITSHCWEEARFHWGTDRMDPLCTHEKPFPTVVGRDLKTQQPLFLVGQEVWDNSCVVFNQLFWRVEWCGWLWGLVWVPPPTMVLQSSGPLSQMVSSNKVSSKEVGGKV